MTDREWQHIERFYALRCYRTEGWQIVGSVLALDALLKRLSARRIEVQEIVVLDRTVFHRLPPRGRPARRQGARPGEGGHMEGWAYDKIRRCWWPPRQPITLPDAELAISPGLAVEFVMPEAGWLPISVTCGSRQVKFSASNVYDPIRNLVAWLERVLTGSYDRFVFDVEGWVVEFHLAQARLGLVRFVIAFAGGMARRTFELDTLVTRQHLAAAFYAPLRRLWHSEALKGAPEQWFQEADVVEDPVPRDIYAIDSAVLDALIND